MENVSGSYLELNCYHMIENPMRKQPKHIPKWVWMIIYQRRYSRKIENLIQKDMEGGEKPCILMG